MPDGLDSYLVVSPSEGPCDFPGPHRIDPLRVDAAPFLDLIQRLDALVNGPAGRALPRWAFYDCAELPGAVAGFCRPARDLSDRGRELMHVESGYDGPVPQSQAAVIPMAEPGSWHVYASASLDRADPNLAPAGLTVATIAMALRTMGATTAYAAAPWRSPVVTALTELTPLELLTAWTPAHSEHATMTVRFAVSAPGDETPAATTWIATDDTHAQRRLQSAIEAGHRFQIVDRLTPDGVPLREVTSS